MNKKHNKKNENMNPVEAANKALEDRNLTLLQCRALETNRIEGSKQVRLSLGDLILAKGIRVETAAEKEEREMKELAANSIYADAIAAFLRTSVIVADAIKRVKEEEELVKLEAEIKALEDQIAFEATIGPNFFVELTKIDKAVETFYRLEEEAPVKAIAIAQDIQDILDGFQALFSTLYANHLAKVEADEKEKARLAHKAEKKARKALYQQAALFCQRELRLRVQKMTNDEVIEKYLAHKEEQDKKRKADNNK